jgi:hypothetical protein
MPSESVQGVSRYTLIASERLLAKQSTAAKLDELAKGGKLQEMSYGQVNGELISR